jgi:hypothetical protein
MTTNPLIEKLHIEITAIHGEVHNDIGATIAEIGERIDILEKTALVLLASYQAKDMEGFQTALRLMAVSMLPPPVLPAEEGKEGAP